LCTAGPAAITITNNGGDMLEAQSFVIMQDGTNDVTPTSDTFQLANGASVTITLTGLDPYASYRLTSNNFAGSLDYTHDCSQPSLNVSSNCASPVAITITNNGADMLQLQSFTIMQNGTTDVTPATDTFQLVSGDSVTITLAGLDPYAEYVFATSGFAGSANYTHDCGDPDVEIVSGDCGTTIEFTITNNGDDMLEAQSFTITQDGTTDVTPAVDTFQLVSGDIVTITITVSDPYAAYTISTAGFAGDVDFTHDCDNPDFDVTSGREIAG
jgi:archaellum component FlaF (FlaF/FlaG flagellin family)